MLNAEYRLFAESGKGVAKNSIGITGSTMPISFTKVTANSMPNSYHYQDKYSPDAVIFYMTSNDYDAIKGPS
jgi:hypothetical protein